jgi:hypothetical protein
MSAHARLKTAIEGLGTATLAVGFAGAVAASRVAPPRVAGQLDETAKLLGEIGTIARSTGPPAADPAFAVAARQVEAAIAEIEHVARVADWPALRALAADPCVVPARPAMLLLSTGATCTAHGAGSITLEIFGSRASVPFSFASGTAQVHIIAAINSFAPHLGVSASVNAAHPERVTLCSTKPGTGGFVRVRQQGDGDPIIFLASASPAGVADAKSWGTDRVTWSAQQAGP